MSDDARLDALIESALPPEPPDDVPSRVTPWRRAMCQILWGIGLRAVTFSFFALDYILPGLGFLLMLCGSRTLRRVNACFRALHLVTALECALFVSALAAQCAALSPDWVSSAVGYAMLPMQLLVTLLLWGGIRGVQASAGLEPHAPAAIWLLVWYLLLTAAGLAGGQLGWIGAILFLGAFALIIRSLYKLYSALDEAGYAVEAAPGRISNLALAIGVTALTAALMLCGWLFLSRYPMDWQSAEENGESAVRTELAELGFPEDVLADLTDEDAARCAGALAVYCHSELNPVNEGREEITRRADGVRVQSTVYDVKELRSTAVAVELPEGRWVVFHHFRWVEPVSFYGSEAIKIWSQVMDSDGWARVGEPGGRVLCDRDGGTLSADFRFLGELSYSYESMFFGRQEGSNLFAAFSAPLRAEGLRGYVCYEALSLEDGWIFDSWMDYTHQLTPFQLPARTALDKATQGSWNRDGAFLTVQTAFHFDPGSDAPGEIEY